MSSPNKGSLLNSGSNSSTIVNNIYIVVVYTHTHTLLIIGFPFWISNFCVLKYSHTNS